MTMIYMLGEAVAWKDRISFVAACNSHLARQVVSSADPDGVIRAFSELSESDLRVIRNVNHNFHTLDSWESSKLRNLTIQQINDRIDTVQAQIDAVTNVATAKTALNSMYADMQKMAQIIIWQLKREMGELE